MLKEAGREEMEREEMRRGDKDGGRRSRGLETKVKADASLGKKMDQQEPGMAKGEPSQGSCCRKAQQSPKLPS